MSIQKNKPMPEDNFQKIIARYSETLKGIQAGRAEPSLIENIVIDVYGQKMPLKQAATISVPEPRLFMCQVWDQNNLAAIEKALNEANLGLSVSSDGNVIRAVLPELTAERREELVKLVNQKKEAARIEVRQARETVIKDFKNQNLSEDEIEQQKTVLDKQVAEANDHIDKITAEKEEALRKV